jgi:sterol desaturase/sphingolipid hydroxylase (fatty acid hydroxylase superfamily)
MKKKESVWIKIMERALKKDIPLVAMIFGSTILLGYFISSVTSDWIKLLGLVIFFIFMIIFYYFHKNEINKVEYKEQLSKLFGRKKGELSLGNFSLFIFGLLIGTFNILFRLKKTPQGTYDIVAYMNSIMSLNFWVITFIAIMICVIAVMWKES